MTLNDLMAKYGSDKSAHGYCDFYEAFFYPVRERVKSVLEIGVADGASIRAWYKYFPNADIWAMDAKEGLLGRYGDRDKWSRDEFRVVYCEGDQANRKHLAELIANKADGSWDIVIDDGGHTMEQQQVSLGVLFPHTRMFYVVEDLHTSFMPEIRIYDPHGPVRSYPTGAERCKTYDMLWTLRDFCRYEDGHEPEMTAGSWMTEAEWLGIYAKLTGNEEAVHIFDRDGDRRHMTSILEVR